MYLNKGIHDKNKTPTIEWANTIAVIDSYARIKGMKLLMVSISIIQ